MSEKPGTPAPRTARLLLDELCRDTPCPLLHAAGRKACHVVFDAGGDSEGAFCSSRIALALERALATCKTCCGTKLKTLRGADCLVVDCPDCVPPTGGFEAFQERYDRYMRGEISYAELHGLGTPTDKGSGEG